MRDLALHHITAIEASPPELVEIAAAVGCPKVCIFVRSPLVEGRFLFPTVTPETLRDMKTRLVDRGISVMNVEYFPLEAGGDVDAYRAALEMGGELGAERAVTHVHDTDEGRAAANLARLCDLAADYGLTVGLEFMGLSPGCNSLAKAQRLVARADRRNLGIAIDALHFARTGCTVAEVAALDPGLVAYAQLCDGPDMRMADDYLPEALDRLAPGEGVFPLVDLVRALPPETPLDVEVPSEVLRRQGMPPLERARRAVGISRTLLMKADNYVDTGLN